MPTDTEILHALFAAALGAALPDGKFAGRLPPRPKGRTIVLGAGKASARMAAAFEEAWMGTGAACEGLVVTRYGHAVPTTRIEIVEAAHPVPDEAGMSAAARILRLAEGAGPDDLVVALISGGREASR
jgi:glycerate 2-kinase